MEDVIAKPKPCVSSGGIRYGHPAYIFSGYLMQVDKEGVLSYKGHFLKRLEPNSKSSK